jgi:8-oxo-dGTP pyrophosphatase MutT (NUDIX family)
MPDPIALDLVLARLTEAAPRVVTDATGDWKHAAVAAVFRSGPDGAELLYIQRAEHDQDPWSGQVGFPGGRAEEVDDGLEGTAARETLEEVGLDLYGDPEVLRLGALDQLQARARQRILPMAITPFAFVHRGTERPTLTLSDGEVDEVFWVPLSRLCDPGRAVWYPHPMQSVQYEFPAIDVGEGRNVLWGLTHYMTMEILLRLGLIDDVGALTVPRVSP